MICEKIYRFVKTGGRAARRVTLRLSGYAELQAQLNHQESVLRDLKETVLPELLRTILQDFEKSQRDKLSRKDLDQHIQEVRASLDERFKVISQQQVASQTAMTATVKATETAVLEAIIEETDRLDGYLLFHANELRAAVAGLDRNDGFDVPRSSERARRPLSKAD